MKKVNLFVIVVLMLALANQVALAAGANPPSDLSQSPTPTSTHQVFMPAVGVASDGESLLPATESKATEAKNAGQSPLAIWLFGVALLVVFVLVYVLLRRSAKRGQSQ